MDSNQILGKDIKKNTDECVKVIEEAIFDMQMENQDSDSLEYD